MKLNWKERCNNSYYISTAHKYGILSDLAIDTFDKSDWRMLRECMNRSMDCTFTKKGIIYKKEKKITIKQLLDCYMSAFTCMQMIFD